MRGAHKREGLEGGRHGTYNVALLVVGRTAGQRCAGDQKGCGRGEECGKDDEKEEKAEAAGAHVGNGEGRPVLGGRERGNEVSKIKSDCIKVKNAFSCFSSSFFGGSIYIYITNDLV